MVPEHTAPSYGELCEAYADPLPALHRPVAEDDPLAEALCPLGVRAVTQDLTVLAVLAAEPQLGLAAAKLKQKN